MELITIENLAEILEVSKSTIRRWVSEGNFPPPIRVSEGVHRWDMVDVNIWLEKKKGNNNGTCDHT